MGQRGPSKRIASIRARIGTILFKSLEAASRTFRTLCCCFVLSEKASRRSVSRVLSKYKTLDGHSSGTFLAERLARPTRAADREIPASLRCRRKPAAPIRSCSRWGLPCQPCYQSRGALLPHRFTLALKPEGCPAVCFLWHCPWGRPRRLLAGTVFPWSPDFPPPDFTPGSGRPTVWIFAPCA